MSTTLMEARTALVRLSAQFPAPSTYATHLATLSDYFDNQVPLNIENKSLHQRIAVLEACIDDVRKALPADPSIVTFSIVSEPGGDANEMKADVGNRRFATIERKPIDCSAWMGQGCKCTACRVRAHA